MYSTRCFALTSVDFQSLILLYPIIFSLKLFRKQETVTSVPDYLYRIFYSLFHFYLLFSKQYSTFVVTAWTRTQEQKHFLVYSLILPYSLLLFLLEKYIFQYSRFKNVKQVGLYDKIWRMFFDKVYYNSGPYGFTLSNFQVITILSASCIGYELTSESHCYQCHFKVTVRLRT